jgi:hypothetical protein
MNGREGEASAARRYTDAGATNFAATPGRRRNERYATASSLPPVAYEGPPNVPRFQLINGDCRTVMANMGDGTVDAIVTDPPYHLTSIVKRFGRARPRNNSVPTGRSRGPRAGSWGRRGMAATSRSTRRYG